MFGWGLLGLFQRAVTAHRWAARAASAFRRVARSVSDLQPAYPSPENRRPRPREVPKLPSFFASRDDRRPAELLELFVGSSLSAITDAPLPERVRREFR